MGEKSFGVRTLPLKSGIPACLIKKTLSKKKESRERGVEDHREGAMPGQLKKFQREKNKLWGQNERTNSRPRLTGGNQREQ